VRPTLLSVKDPAEPPPSEYPWLGYGRFGTDPGTGGNQYNVAFNVTSTGLGLLTPDPNFYDSVFSGMQFYYNPDDTLLYLAGSQTDAKKIGANLVGVCLELVDANDSAAPTACKAAKPVKRWLWAEYTDGSGEGWIGNDPNAGVGGLKWGIPTVGGDPRTSTHAAVSDRHQDVLHPCDAVHFRAGPDQHKHCCLGRP
jgi:hypothetical protein